jgi:hypothetical protein
MEKRIQKVFVDYGFGFPVNLKNVPMVKVRGHWTPNINYNVLTKAVLIALAHKVSRLTGDEVKFIRNHFEMTLEDFAKRFSVTHVAVLKWEKSGEKSTSMNWSTEKDMRLYILHKLSKKLIQIATLYETLEQMPDAKPVSVCLDLKEVA